MQFPWKLVSETHLPLHCLWLPYFASLPHLWCLNSCSRRCIGYVPCSFSRNKQGFLKSQSGYYTASSALYQSAEGTSSCGAVIVVPNIVEGELFKPALPLKPLVSQKMKVVFPCECLSVIICILSSALSSVQVGSNLPFCPYLHIICV